MSFNQRRRWRGSMVVAVLMMLAFVAVTVTALAVVFATEVKRTRTAASGAQLRQLLLAAPPVAVEELRRNGTGERELPVATPVENATLVLRIRPQGDERVQVQAVAKWQGAAAAQSLTYQREGNAWKLHSASLGRQP